MKKRIISSAVALGAALAVMAGGVAMADPSASNIDPNETGSLTIHKFAGSTWAGNAPEDGTLIDPSDYPAGAEGLEGVTFKACLVNDLDVTDPADWPAITALNTAITGSPNHALPEGTTLSTTCYEGTTGGDGTVALPGLTALGVYYVTETDVPATVAERVLPFLVTIPLAHNTDSSWIYDVHVYPKNAVTELTKEAVDPGPLGVGDKVQWNVTQTAPKTQYSMGSYRLLDELDSRLTYVANSSKVTLGGVALEATDFGVTAEGTPELLTMTLTSTGMAKLNAVKDSEASAAREVVWSFETTVLTIGDGTIKNQAVVWINNPTGTWEDGEKSEPVSSNWGAVQIKKLDNKTGLTLDGAVFQVFGSEAEANACVTAVKAANGSLPAGCEDVIYDTDKKVAPIVTYRDKDGAEISGGLDKFTTVDGLVTIPGLDTGIDSTNQRNYWLVEIVPPAGYVNAEKTYPVTVTTGGLATGLTTEIISNAQQPPTTLPMTGAQVRMIMIVAAALLGAGAIALVVVDRRKVARNA